MTPAQYHSINKKLEHFQKKAKKEDFHLVEIIPDLKLYQYKNQCYFISIQEYVSRFEKAIKKDFW